MCSLAPVAPAISVTRRSIAVWMSSSVGANANVPARELLLDAVERGDDHLRARRSVEQADAREHVHVRARTGEVVGREAAVERQADGEREQLVGRALAEAAVPQRLPGRARRRSASLTWHPGPGGATTSRADSPHSRTKPSESCVAERVLGVVGREVVVVEAARRAPADRVAATRLEPQPHLAGHVLLRRRHERVERAHQRRVPQAVVDQLGDADLEPLLLARDVAFERDALEILVREDRARATPGTRRPRGS